MQEYKVTVYNNRTEWRDLKTLKPHRLNGPAIEHANGSKEWWVEGKRHRLDGPAIEDANGYKAWCVEGKFHRLDGPAYEGADGSKYWYVEGKLHRLDGPAIEGVNGFKEWWIEGKECSEQTFNEYVANLNNSFEVDGKKYKLTLHYSMRGCKIEFEMLNEN